MSFLGENRSVAYIYQNFYGLYVMLFLEVQKRLPNFASHIK